MVMQEKKCPYCKQFFFYDDGIIESLPLHEQTKLTGYCPVCIDPNAITGQTYEKTTILTAIKRHLKSKGVEADILDDDTLINMLKEFPRVHGIYYGTTYKTFTINTGDIFDGERGKFEIRETKSIDLIDSNGTFKGTLWSRCIKCCRCGRIVTVTKTEAMDMFLGLYEKRCVHCDPTVSNHKRNTSNLKRTGAVKSEFSERAIAKALNISRSDFRRAVNPQYTPPLPVGSIVEVGSYFKYEILEAWWDEDPKSYAPKYKYKCLRCNEIFICIQKNIRNGSHYCP